MGFCRRCGNIVSNGPLCSCGGSSVAGTVASRVGQSPSSDRWSKIYTSPTKPSFALCDSNSSTLTFTPDGSPVRRVTALSTVGVRGSSILASQSPSSPPKSSLDLSLASTIDNETDDTADITLTNIFGSLLQDSESFTKHACIECNSEFPPDSTIYPHPEDPDSNSYLCYSCFVLNGGSKGSCASCERPVLILKAEGKFVKYNDHFWHSDCFRCRGCYKDLSSSPEVDLLGNPCCATCFDSCATYAVQQPPKDAGEHTMTAEGDLVDELVQRLQGCAVPASSRKNTPRRHSSAKSTPSTTPIRSARRISSRGEHKQSPRNMSEADQESDENAVSMERLPFTKSLSLSGRSSERDVFGPLQINQMGRNAALGHAKQHQDIVNLEKTPPIVQDIAATSEARAQHPSRFGTPAACPGCHLAVSPMERGVVPGPQGTRWHATCLICGGKREEKDEKESGCGKKLDSSAKTDRAGRIFCRNCLFKNELPRDMRPSPQASPIRNCPIKPVNTGSGSSIFATRGPGVSTLVRQMTGNGLGFIANRSFNRSPSPVSPLRSSTTDSEISAIDDLSHSQSKTAIVTQHVTGEHITKLTHQLTGNGLTFLTSGAHPQTPKGLRSASPELPALSTVTEEEDNTTGSRREIRESSDQIRSPSRDSGGWGLSRQGSISPTRQLRSGSTSPTRATFSRRPMSLLGSRHAHHKSLDEREGRGMFLVRQMTGNGVA